MRKNLRNLGRWVSFSSLLYTFGHVSLAFADGPAVPAGSSAGGGAAAAAPQAPGLGSMIVPFALMFGVVYFLMIRPQQKKMKDQQQMLSELKQGDDVLTSSGILGKVAGITEKVVTIEVADNVKIKMLKSQVSQIVKGQISDIAQ